MGPDPNDAGFDCLNSSSTCDELIDNRNNGQHDKNVHEASRDMKYAKAQNPEDKKDYCYCPDHNLHSF